MQTVMIHILLVTIAYLDVSLAHLQAYAVKGRLVCGSQPAANVTVKLVDEDDGINPDDEMDVKLTDANGGFLLEGKADDELSDIDPRLKIYHDCNDDIPLCQRKWKINLPDKYIDNGVMDVGILNLEMELNEEEHDCGIF